MKRVVFLLAVSALWFCLPQAGVHAQDPTSFVCGTTESGSPPGGLEIPLVGEFHALAIFVKFRDDTTNYPCSRGYGEWLDDEPVPAMAPHLLSPSPTPPFPDSSLTSFFYEQSNQNFVMYGDTVSYVTQLDELDYFPPDTSALFIGVLAREAFESLRDSGRVDFSNYDANGDGYLDHVFMILRGIPSGGCMFIGPGGGCAGGVFGYWV